MEGDLIQKLETSIENKGKEKIESKSDKNQSSSGVSLSLLTGLSEAVNSWWNREKVAADIKEEKIENETTRYYEKCKKLRIIEKKENSVEELAINDDDRITTVSNVDDLENSDELITTKLLEILKKVRNEKEEDWGTKEAEFAWYLWKELKIEEIESISANFSKENSEKIKKLKNDFQRERDKLKTAQEYLDFFLPLWGKKTNN